MGISRIFFLVFTINFLFHKCIRNFASIFGLYLPELSLMIWMKAFGPLKHVNGWEIEIINFYLGLQCHWTRSKNVTFRTNIFFISFRNWKFQYFLCILLWLISFADNPGPNKQQKTFFKKKFNSCVGFDSGCMRRQMDNFVQDLISAHHDCNSDNLTIWGWA